jgi:glucose/arabinose dehydrogenase
MIKNIIAVLNLIPVLVSGQVQVIPKNSGSLEDIMLPKGYTIELYVAGVDNAREMDFAEDGTLFVGSSDAGKVYAIRPDRTVIIIDDNLEMPAGLDYYNSDLYVAGISRILKYENILRTMSSSPEPIVVNSNFPKDAGHELKFIKTGPDGKLYIPVGAACNACIPDGVWHGRLVRMSLDGKEIEYFAEGIRSIGGIDWNPATGVLWFTENGRDDLGEGIPSDELNKIMADGEHFGFPYMHGKQMDNEFWPKRPKNKAFISPAMELPALVAPMGMRFYTGQMFDKKYWGGIFIAEHGSFNRSGKTGCRISFITLSEDRAKVYEVFAAGWLQGETAWGRPADVQVGPDGSLFISDDLAGCIYRIFK